MSLSRRELLRAAGAASLASATGIAPKQDEEPAPQIERRKLGSIGFEASIYALGTAEIPGDDEALRAIHLALDGGVNYIDTAPSYREARSETVVGRVAKERRADFFLATKTQQRSADGALREVRESLARLQTSTIDLLQVHAVNDAKTLARVLGESGAVKGLERARADGLIRHIGITGHTRPEVILEALEAYPFESILVPTSAADSHLTDFAEEVLPRAAEKGISIAGMKSLKGLEIHAGGIEDAEPYVRYALSLPLSTLTIGFQRIADVEKNLAIARRFQTMGDEEREELLEATRAWSSPDVLWWKRR